ncbi:MAG: hypothetical protein SU899_03560 [Chloroflexota bacterium]|nr:hypothetical protein [Chloroflexota bacterium]
MKWYRIKFKAKSWFSSDWQADTIWGHLCWGLNHLYGEQKLSDFIAAYNKQQPLVLVSNGFPDDLLPRPILPQVPLDSRAELEEQKEQFKRQKDAKKATFLDYEEFALALKGEIIFPSSKAKIKQRVTLKNQINRITNTTGTGEGTLYPFEEYYYNTITIYAKIAEGFEDTAQRLFDYLAKTGYGKRKSVGYGWLEMLEFEPFSGFDSPSDANGFVSLSNFVPAAQDPAQGYWNTLIKYGKLGEEYANSDNPFKKPLLMLTAGSVFYDSAIREYYGKLVAELNTSHPKVVQYGFALPVPMKIIGG